MGRLFTFLFCFADWCVLTWMPGESDIITGAVISLFISLIFGESFNIQIFKAIQPKRFFYFIYFILFMLLEMIRSGIEMTLRMFYPLSTLKPGIIKIKTNLKSDISQMFLANSISLLPSTMTVDTQKGFLYVHWLDVKTTDAGSTAKMISGKLEKMIREVFE